MKSADMWVWSTKKFLTFCLGYVDHEDIFLALFGRSDLNIYPNLRFSVISLVLDLRLLFSVVQIRTISRLFSFSRDLIGFFFAVSSLLWICFARFCCGTA